MLIKKYGTVLSIGKEISLEMGPTVEYSGASLTVESMCRNAIGRTPSGLPVAETSSDLC